MPSGKRVLVVEDEALVAIEIAAILRDAGYEVLGPVGTGIAGFTRAMASSPDLVLMDIGLPGATDGIGAASAIRDQMNLPIVYVTGNTDLHLMDRVIASRPAGFVQKPFTPEELLRAVRQALQPTVEA
jgi:DNA-binding NarL/FixJ family response regulator